MDTFNLWTKEELLAYILLFVANSNLKQTNSERDFILSRVDRNIFQEISDEFDLDNDYQSIKKIIKAINTHEYFHEDYEGLFTDIKLMLYADGKSDQFEQSVFTFLKKILVSKKLEKSKL